MTLTPETARFLLETLYLPSLQREHATTRKVIESIPLDKGDYRPDPASKSALELAWHIVAAEKRFLNGIADGQFDFNAISRPDSAADSAGIARWYGDMFAATLPRLQHLTGDQLCRVLDFRGIFQAPAVLFFQTSLLHSVHHRGQLSTYLRPVGGKVPAIYGESYDSAEARKAAEAKAAESKTA